MHAFVFNSEGIFGGKEIYFQGAALVKETEIGT
jgi:hypothetical protein